MFFNVEAFNKIKKQILELLKLIKDTVFSNDNFWEIIFSFPKSTNFIKQKGTWSSQLRFRLLSYMANKIW